MTDSATDQTVPRLNRQLNGLVSVFSILLTFGSVAWAADWYTAIGLQLYNEQFLAAMLGLVLVMAYLTLPVRRHGQGKLPWYDAAAALLGFAASWYVAIQFPTLANEIAYRPLDAMIISVILLLLILEGVRRAAGPVLVIILLFFFAYALFGHLIPGKLTGRNLQLEDLLIGLALDPQALLGIPMKIGTTVVISFLLLGQVLFLSGGSGFFTGIAMSGMGRYRGGSAKIAVAASSLFGSISGSAVSNVVSTGVITIPLMRDSGYTAESAGAIEAVASTGGQLMPPLMGASAFVMAEFLEVPYADVVLAALIPAFLYYLALFVVTDLEAAKTGIARIAIDKLPKAWPVLKAGWFFPLPFGVLIYGLFGANLRPEEAALYAVVVLLGCAIVFGYEGKRAGPMMIIKSLEETGKSCIELLLIVAVAGLMIGLLNISGLGFALTYSLVAVGGGNLAVLLGLAALICVVLGMGMPTLGVYVLVAALVAPSLVELGVAKMAAHLFVLYFGMMSMITPPVAIAAFAAASLTRADAMRTGFAAVRFGWVAYVIPFLFVLSPGLLMEGSVAGIIIALITASIGVWLGSVGLIGYFIRPLSRTMRVIFMVTGFSAMLPSEAFEASMLFKLGGIAIGAVVVIAELAIRRRTAAVSSG
ncbi:MAG: TRAP transporter fused permease subunit [Pseudomonadota bacterium]|nr:TRAP transporter fused permease subunit [Pseudomonadota bacterium]